jgi:hypothetical protein
MRILPRLNTMLTNMEMGQGFIATTQELNVDRGTLPAGVASSSKDLGDLNPVTG